MLHTEPLPPHTELPNHFGARGGDVHAEYKLWETVIKGRVKTADVTGTDEGTETGTDREVAAPS